MSKSACTCGHNVKDGNEDTQQLNIGTFLSRTQLDASFVYLPTPTPNMNENVRMQHDDDSFFFSQGMLDSYRYHNTMLQVAEKQIDHSQGFGNEADICLCSDCIERLVVKDFIFNHSICVVFRMSDIITSYSTRS